MRTIFFLSGLTLLIGCDDKADDTASTDDTFAPTAGQWSWQGTTYTTDECNMADAFPAETIDATQWDLVLTDDGFSTTRSGPSPPSSAPSPEWTSAAASPP